MGNQFTRSARWGACLLIGIAFAVPGVADEPKHDRSSPARTHRGHAEAAVIGANGYETGLVIPALAYLSRVPCPVVC
jgi:hypothetical protein